MYSIQCIDTDGSIIPTHFAFYITATGKLKLILPDNSYVLIELFVLLLRKFNGFFNTDPMAQVLILKQLRQLQYDFHVQKKTISAVKLIGVLAR